MRTSFGTIAASILAVAAISNPGLRADEPPARALEVTGAAEITVAPEVAVVALAVETEAPDAAAAAARNAEAMERVLAAVREVVGELGKVTTMGYGLSPRYGNPETRGGEPEITGYVAQNRVRAELRDLSAVGKLIDAAIGAGANRVDELSFGLAEDSRHRSEALARAARAARQEAEVLAEALGVRLGPVLSATTTEAPRPMPMARTMAFEAKASTPIEPGEVTVRASVLVRFAIE